MHERNRRTDRQRQADKITMAILLYSASRGNKIYHTMEKAIKSGAMLKQLVYTFQNFQERQTLKRNVPCLP